MDTTTILFIIIFIILIWLYTQNCQEDFIIPQDTILGGDYIQYVPMVLEEPSDEDTAPQFASDGDWVPYTPPMDAAEGPFADDDEYFYIPQNIVVGGAYEDTGYTLATDGQWIPYNAPLELTGPPPGDDAY